MKTLRVNRKKSCSRRRTSKRNKSAQRSKSAKRQRIMGGGKKRKIITSSPETSSSSPPIHQLIHPHVNTNAEFSALKHQFAVIVEQNPDMVYNRAELSPANWRMGPAVTERFTPLSRQELNDALERMFPFPKTDGERAELDRTVLEELGPVATWDTHNIDNMARLSSDMQNDMDGTWPYDISTWDMHNVKTMSGMFSRCETLRHVDCSRWDTRKVEDMSLMFNDCPVLEHVNLCVDVTQVQTMHGMFSNCSRLQTVNLVTPTFNLDTNVRSMFWGVPSTARATMPPTFNPWHWYLSNLNPASGSAIAFTNPVSPLMPATTAFHLDNSKFFGSFTCAVFRWQNVEPTDAARLFFRIAQWSELQQRQLQAAVDYLYEKTVPALECTAACGTPSRKQWRSASPGHPVVQLGATRTPAEQACIDTQKAHDEARFQTFIRTQHRASTGTESPSPSVLVLAQVHGEFNNCDDTMLCPLPMFTLPPGKSLIILSFSTPGAGNVLIKYTEDIIAREYRERLLKVPQRVEMDTRPVQFTQQLLNKCVESKKGAQTRVKKMMEKNTITDFEKHQQYQHFLASYEHPQILYFKEGDNCADKTFTTEAGKFETLVSIRENRLDRSDRSLIPPLNTSYTTVPSTQSRTITLSELCYQMFVVSGHSTVILVDYTCSVFSWKPDPDVFYNSPSRRDRLASRVFDQRFGGGAYNHH